MRAEHELLPKEELTLYSCAAKHRFKSCPDSHTRFIMEGHFAVTVPPGAGPGQQLNVRAPTGETLTVIIPPAMHPGSQFMVPLPQRPVPAAPVQAQVVQSPQPKVYQVNIESTRPAQPVYAEQVQSPRPAPPSSPAGTFPVIVPAGHFSGMQLSVRASA